MYLLGQKYVLLQSTPCNYNETNLSLIFANSLVLFKVTEMKSCLPSSRGYFPVQPVKGRTQFLKCSTLKR